MDQPANENRSSIIPSRDCPPLAIELSCVFLIVAAATIWGWLPGRVFAPQAGPNRRCIAWTQDAVARLGGGEIPLWDQQIQLGLPLIAIGRSAVFFPTTFLHLLLGPTWSWTLAAMLKLLAAAAGAWLLARRLGLTAPGRVMAAVSFALAGLWLQAPQDALVNVGVVTPWIILAVKSLMQRQSPFRLAAASLIIALACLGGDPPAILAALLLVLAVAIAAGALLCPGCTSGAWWIANPAASARCSLPGFFLALAALAIGMALAGIQLIPLGEYLRNLPLLSAAPSLPWWQTPLIASLGDAPWFAPRLFATMSFFAAIFALVFCWRRRQTRYLLGIAILWAIFTAIVLAFLHARLPLALGVLAGRGLLVGILLPLALLAGIGLEAIAQLAPFERRLKQTLKIFFVFLCALAAVAVIGAMARHGPHPAAISLGIGLLISAALIGVAWTAITRVHWKPQAAPTFIILLLAIAEPLALAIPFPLTAHWTLAKAQAPGDVARLSAPTGVIGFGSAPTALVDRPLPLPHAWLAATAEILSPLEVLQHMNQPLEINPRRTVLVSQPEDDTFIEPLSLTEQAARQLPNFPQRNLPAVVYQPISPEEIELNIQGPGSGWLVVADRYYPGWQAYLPANMGRYRRRIMPSQRQAQIVPAFDCLRAVLVTGRTGRVTLVYDPPDWRCGCFVSAGAVLALLLVLGWSLFGEKHGGAR